MKTAGRSMGGCILTFSYIANLWNWQIGVYSGKCASCQWHVAIKAEMCFPACKELRISLQDLKQRTGTHCYLLQCAQNPNYINVDMSI